jgi:hypothetical protein
MDGEVGSAPRTPKSARSLPPEGTSLHTDGDG